MNSKRFEMDKVDQRLSAVYESDKDKESVYDNWAKDYETDLVEDLNYVAHVEAAKVFADLISAKDCRILDVACGTGLVGEELKKLGYKNVDGTDFSNEMLKLSRSRKVYDKLFQHDFTRPAAGNHDYDALICVGMFSFSVPKISHMINVIDMVSPGSLCVVTVNGAAWKEKDLATQVQIESERHGFSIEQILRAGYIEKESIDARVLVIQRAGGT